MSKVTRHDVIAYFKSTVAQSLELAEIVLEQATEIVSAAVDTRQRRLKGLEAARAAKGKGGSKRGPRARREPAEHATAPAAVAASQGGQAATQAAVQQ